MTHLIDGDDLAVVVEPVGLGAKDLHLRSSAGSAGRVRVSAKCGFSSGSVVSLDIRRGARGRRRADLVIAKCRSPPPSTRDTGAPLAARCRERAPAGVAIRLGSEVGRVSPWNHGEGRWARASSPPRAWQPSPHPVGRERGTRAERSAMNRERVFASTARVFGPSARPDTPTARVSGGARGAKVLSFGEICTRRWCRGNGRGWARTAARTRKATRDCFWDLAESFLLALERGINGRKSAHGRPDRTRQRLERPIGKLLSQAVEKNRAGTSSCDAENARGGSRGDAPGDRGAGSEGRGGAGEGGHDCLLGGYRNVRCRVL